MSRRVTLRDVAGKAGVSVTTVSVALRGDPQIPERTRERIMRVASELGYIRHPFLSILGRSRGSGQADSTHVPGVILVPPSLRDSTYYARIPEQARLAGYSFTLEDPRRFIGRSGSRILRARGVVAIFVARGCDGIDFGDFEWNHFCVVTLDVQNPIATGDHLRTATFDPAFELFMKVHRAGCRRIGVLNMHHEPPHPDDSRRLGAFMAAQAQARGTTALPVFDIAFGEQFAAPAIRFIKEHRPDGIIAHSSGHLKQIEEATRGLPTAAVNVHPSDADWCSGWISRQETKVEQALQVMARLIRAGETGIDKPSITHEVQPTWNAGRSLDR